MPRKKKATFVPKKKKTLIPEPNWDKLRKAKTEEEKLAAFKAAEDFAQYEADPKLSMHWLKKWIREDSGWDMHHATVILPDTYMATFSKHGWKAVQLGFMPDSVKTSLENNLLPLLKRAEEIREKHNREIETVELPKDKDFIDPEKVKEWLASWSSYLKSAKSHAESKDPKIRSQYQSAETYVYNMKQYLRTGIWSDSHFGENRENKVLWVCKAIAYDQNGTPKRSEGTWYPDINQVWKKEYE